MLFSGPVVCPTLTFLCICVLGFVIVPAVEGTRHRLELPNPIGPRLPPWDPAARPQGTADSLKLPTQCLAAATAETSAVRACHWPLLRHRRFERVTRSLPAQPVKLP